MSLLLCAVQTICFVDIRDLGIISLKILNALTVLFGQKQCESRPCIESVQYYRLDSQFLVEMILCFVERICKLHFIWISFCAINWIFQVISFCAIIWNFQVISLCAVRRRPDFLLCYQLDFESDFSVPSSGFSDCLAASSADGESRDKNHVCKVCSLERTRSHAKGGRGPLRTRPR